MTESLKTFASLAKEFSGLDLPDWIRGVLATCLFLAVLVAGCGFAYFVCAIYELPPHLQAELARYVFCSTNLVACGLDSLMVLAHIVQVRRCITAFVVYTSVWCLIMGTMGYFTYIDKYLAPFLEGRFNASVFKLSEERKEKLRAWWKEKRQEEGFSNDIKKWDDIRLTTKTGVVVVRTLLIVALLIEYGHLLMVNVSPMLDLRQPTQELRSDRPVESTQSSQSEPLDLEAATEVEVDDFRLMSLSGVLLAWAVFRYSGANRLLRSAVLVIVVTNLFLVAARIGSERGEDLIQFQEVEVKTERANNAMFAGSGYFLLCSISSHVRIYSCESQKIIEANLEQGDVVLYGRSITLRNICRRPVS